MRIELLGIDLAKNVFQLYGADAEGKCVLQRRVRREGLLETVGDLPPCRIGIEACTGAFFWQRRFEALGHEVRIIAPQYVKPFVRRQKNDRNVTRKRFASHSANRTCGSCRRKRLRSRTSNRSIALAGG
jgi:transposase